MSVIIHIVAEDWDTKPDGSQEVLKLILNPDAEFKDVPIDTCMYSQNLRCLCDGHNIWQHNAS